ncbi:hypothetical protein Plhal304r1_c023g0080691 [Plasmopara halstedii]
MYTYAFCINPAGSPPTPSSDWLYLDTVNKMLFNTKTAYSSSCGTAPLTLNSSNVCIKASNTLNDGSANYDMLIFVESSDASPVGFRLQMNNATNAILHILELQLATICRYRNWIAIGDFARLWIKLIHVWSWRHIILLSIQSIRKKLEQSGIRPSHCYGLCDILVFIFCVRSIYTSSDRRLTENIPSISVDLDQYDKLEPDAMKVCGEMVSVMPDESMKEDGDNNLEGCQHNLNYV